MRWKNSKQTRWKRLLDVFISLPRICLVICVWTEHMLYIKYQGLFVFGLELHKQPRKHETHSDLFSTAQNHSVSGTFSNRILTWYKTLWNVNTDRRWERSGWEYDLNLLPFSSNLHEMPCCHVTFFTVCWQKCNSLVSLSYPARAGNEIGHLISDNRECLMCFGGFCRMMCEYLCLSTLEINSRCCDTDVTCQVALSRSSSSQCLLHVRMLHHMGNCASLNAGDNNPYCFWVLEKRTAHTLKCSQ